MVHAACANKKPSSSRMLRMKMKMAMARMLTDFELKAVTGGKHDDDGGGDDDDDDDA